MNKIKKFENTVSVIVPVYATEKYLAQCIDSILCQSYSDLEILLVDDGSVDRSSEICDEYAEKDPRIVVIHQPNQGVSAARNTGIDRSKGAYLTFVDSDDELLPNAVEIMLNDLLKHDADISYGVKSSVDLHGNETNIYEDHICSVYEGMQSLMLSLDGERQTNSACAKLFKRSFLGNTRFEAGRCINEDGFFLFECYVKQPKVVQHNICVYRYFIREGSASSNKKFNKKHLDMIYFSERKKEIINNQFPELREKIVNMEVSTHLFFLEVYCRNKDKKYRKYMKNSIKMIRDNYHKYHSINKHERVFSKIVYYGLYPLYKLLIQIRYGI